MRRLAMRRDNSALPIETVSPKTSGTKEAKSTRRTKTEHVKTCDEEEHNDEKQRGRPNEVGRERSSTVSAVGEPPFIGFPEINTHNSFGTRSRASLLATL